jgi:SNF2 family DNA or RNA helicase
VTSFDVDKFDRELLIRHYAPDMHAYQHMALEFLWDNAFAGLYADMGLGKTVIILMLLKMLREWLPDTRVLIIAPMKVAIQTWPDEIQGWDFSSDLTYTILRHEGHEDEICEAGNWARRNALSNGDDQAEAGKAATKATTAKRHEIKVRLAKENTFIHIINREGVEWLVQHWGSKWPYNTVIIDEASAFKDHSTKRFKALCKVLPFVRRLVELTATPCTESYMNLFAQIYLLDRGERFGTFITHFRNKYFAHNRFSHSYTLLPGADTEIIRKISDICLVMKAEDHLPDRLIPQILRRPVVLETDQLKQYRKFEREFVLRLPDDEFIEAVNGGALAGKLLQLASGCVYDNDGKARFFHDAKIEELREIVEETDGEPLLVAYWYKPNLARLQKAFPQAVVLDKTGSQKDAWNAGRIPMLLVHPASAGHGLNLQLGPGRRIVFFDICWSLELFLQLIGRVARQGQARQVFVHLLMAVGTLDVHVVDKLRRKEGAQNMLFNKLRALRKRLMRENSVSEDLKGIL